MSRFKTSKRIALEELAKRKQSLNYQKHPEKWLVERFGEDDKLLFWDKHGGYENHIWDGTKNPFAEAAAAMANGNWVGIESATGTGKTYYLPRLIYWFLDVFPNSLVVTTAPKKEQLRRVLWTEMANAFPKFKKIRPHAELFTLNLTVDKRTKNLNLDKENEEINVGHEAIGIVSGVGAGEESATKMQGFHRKHMLFVIDELAGMHPSVITAIVNTCTDPTRNLICGVGNPDSVTDALHMFCQLNHTEHIIISGYDHPNIVNNKVIIGGAVTTESLNIRKEEYGEESSFFKSRARGIAPEESSGALIRAKWVDQCTEGHETFAVEYNNTQSFNAVGVDVANSELGDMASECWGTGNRAEIILEFQCPNANHLAYNLLFDTEELEQKKYANYGTPNIFDFDIRPEHIGIDGVGVGVATINSLLDEKIVPISLVGGQLVDVIGVDPEGKLLYEFVSLRAQMYYEAREDLRTAQIILSKNISKKHLKELKKELITPTFSIRAGKIVVESKEDMKKRTGSKSPNKADAFVYWNWIRKGYYKPKKYMPFM